MISTDADALLQVHDLHVAFGGVAALRGVQFSIARHEVVALVGPNGAGKTTVLNAVTRLVRVQRGRIAFQGKDLLPLQAHRLAASGIARTFQNFALVEEQSVVDNLRLGLHCRLRAGLVSQMLRFPAARRDENWAQAQLHDQLRLLGLERQARQQVSELPYGTRKLVELGRALAAAPRLLLLDEPSSGLGPEETTALAQTLLRLRAERGMAMLIVEHDMALVAAVADRVLAIDQGRVIADGPAASVLADPAVIAACIGELVADVEEQAS